MNNSILPTKNSQPIGELITQKSKDSADAKELAGHILEILQEFIDYHKATVQYLEGNKRYLLAYRGFSTKGIDEWLLRPIDEDSLMTRLTHSAQPLVLGDTSKDKDWEKRSHTADVRSWVGLPLVYAGKMVAVITLDHSEPGFYNPEMIAHLRTFSNHAAAVLENKYLIDTSIRRDHDLHFLSEIAGMVSSQLDTENLLKIVIQQIAEKINCAHCAVFAPRKEEGTIYLYPTVIAEKNSSFIKSRRFNLGEGIAGWVYEHGETVLLSDARLDKRFSPPRKG